MPNPCERLRRARTCSGRASDNPTRRPLVGATSAALALTLLLAAAAPALADPAGEQFERDIERLEAQQDEVRAEADRLEQEQTDVREEQRRLDGEIQAATQRLAELEAEFAELTDQAARTAHEVRTLVDERADHRARLGGRARSLYQLGTADPTMLMLSGATTDEVLESAHYVAAMANRDQTRIEAYSASATRLERRQADLGAERREVAALQEEVEAARAGLTARLEEAAALEDRLVALQEEAAANLAQLEEEERTRRAEEKARLAEIERKRREEEARRRAAEAEAEARRRAQRAEAAAAQQSTSRPSRSGTSGGTAPSAGGKACPQGQPRSFINDWGFPRSGGRSHQGTDVFGRMGGPVYAITSGTIQFTKVGASAGLFLSLAGDDGNTYWYMHLSRFLVGAGARVSAGQLIASNGDTGNAKGTPPHVHFEYHPGGGGPVNPYPLLKAVCG